MLNTPFGISLTINIAVDSFNNVTNLRYSYCTNLNLNDPILLVAFFSVVCVCLLRTFFSWSFVVLYCLTFGDCILPSKKSFLNLLGLDDAHIPANQLNNCYAKLSQSDGVDDRIYQGIQKRHCRE